MIFGLGQDEEPEEEGNGEEPVENGDGVIQIQPYPYPITEPYPYPVYYSLPQQQGLQIGSSVIPEWALVLGLGLLAGYVVGGRT